MVFALSVAVVVAALLVGCSRVRVMAPAPAPSSGQTVAAIAADYSNYRKMTDADVFVNPELATLCVGASQFHVETARKTKGPHAHTAIRVMMNDSAAQTFGRGAGGYAPGAVIVKQKTLLPTRDGAPAGREPAMQNGVGGMVKRAPGFDPAHGDWEYFYFDDATKIESGRIASCIACHEDAKGTDYVFGTWAGRRDGLLRL